MFTHESERHVACSLIQLPFFETVGLVDDTDTDFTNYSCLHRLLPVPFLLSNSVFVFSFSLFFRFCAVR